MSDAMVIRRADMGDAWTIAAFNVAMAQETEQRTLPGQTVLDGVRNLIAHPEYGFYLVAESDTRPAACLLITYEWSDWRNGLFWWIQSVYVQPGFRRQGIYRRMYQELKTMAAAEPGVCGFRLYVEKDNLPARKTYSDLGMEETPYRMYEELITR